MLIEALGWAAAACATVVALPQVVRLLRSSTAAGVSQLAWQITLGANIAWMAHGFATGHANIWVPNLVFGIYSTLVLVRLRRFRPISWQALLGPAIALGLLTYSLEIVAGPVAFAVGAFLPSALAQVVQLQALVISTDIRGVSMSFLAMNVINQVLWVSWALLSGEVSVTLVGSSLGTLMLLNLVVAVLRRTGTLRARLAQMHA